MSNEDTYRNILTAVLDCGYADISVIDSCEYDFQDLMEGLKDLGMDVNLNNLAYMMFDFGKRDIREYIDNRIEAINEELESEEDSNTIENLNEELEALKQLEPYDDIESFHNYLDTSVYFNCGDEKEEFYRRYCSDALDTFEENTGFGL